ncbi:hypothetical protein [Agrobacterium pusense]|uniref:hypothetical protein n=1 Tax=Agrobacterium pusense TaxID=648995 RepID=UPI0022B8EAD7|nr:hypothetical protein [Agrobacterium pusense]MCZ7929495.1 hypothetical protein [Agrobacterium pusense]
MMGTVESIFDLRSLLSIVAEETGALKMNDADEDCVGWTAEGPRQMTFGHVRRAHSALAALEAALSAAESVEKDENPMRFFADKVDNWGALEWFNRMADACEDHDRKRRIIVQCADEEEKDILEISANTSKMVMTSSAFHLARECKDVVVSALSAQVQDADEQRTETCQRCQGNGEIVTDWERYRHPHANDVGDEAVAECPDCDGFGNVSAQVQDVAGAETTTRFHIEWIAGARPPVHPSPMTGRTTFESFERAVQHMKSQADDAQFVSLEERRTTIVHIDRSADMRAALPAAPSQQEASHVTSQ